MPAQLLRDEPVPAHRYDVAAHDSQDLPNFVQHVGLFADDRSELRRNDQVPLVHMGPPLETGEGTIAIQSMGTAALRTDDILQIQIFIDDRAAEYEAAGIRQDKRAQYCVLPHVESFQELDGTVTYWKFSCAGFVIEAYRFAGLDLLITDQGRIPPVGLHLLDAAYPGIAASPRLRAHFKLQGDGPWNVVLAGYVLNALNRPADAIRREPHQPTRGDAFFPGHRM
jgi:hypothetical protein